MRRIVMVTLVVGSLIGLGIRDVRACNVPCACLDADQDGSEDDLVCCGVAGEEEAGVEDALDAATEGQACGRVFAAVGFGADPLFEIAGRVSPEGAAGCGCLDVDGDGTAEAAETFPPGGDCGRTAAMACLSGHQPPVRDCATIGIGSAICASQ